MKVAVLSTDTYVLAESIFGWEQGTCPARSFFRMTKARFSNLNRMVACDSINHHQFRRSPPRLRDVGRYAVAMRLTLICRSRSRDWARPNANCMPSHVLGVEPDK